MSEEEKHKENKIKQDDSGSDQNKQPEDVEKKPDNNDQLQSGSESYMSVDEITSVSKNEISGEGGSVLSSPPIYSDTACLAPQPERIK